MIALPSHAEVNSYFGRNNVLDVAAADFRHGYQYLAAIYQNAYRVFGESDTTHDACMHVVHRFLASLHNELTRGTREDVYIKLAAFRVIHQLCVSHSVLHPRINFKLKGTTAGEALAGERVRINFVLLRENPIYFHFQTLPHEIAHIAKSQRGIPGRPHGPEWKAIMREMNAEPLVTHRLDTSNVERYRRGLFPYICGCGRKHELDADQHGSAQIHGARYQCPSCTGDLAFKPSSIHEMILIEKAKAKARPRKADGRAKSKSESAAAA